MNNFNDENNSEIFEEKKESQSLKPYIEALKFFTKIKIISNHFTEKYLKNNSNKNLPKGIKSIDKFINYFIKNNIYTLNGDDSKKREEKEYLRENPDKIFNFILNELHKIFKDENNKKDDKEEESKDNENKQEYDSQAAKLKFKNFMEHDKSEIRELFFGLKKITKYCTSCSLNQYIYKYIKVIPLTIKDNANIEEVLELNNLFPSIEQKFNKKLFCSMCSSEQDFIVEIKITKKPKILIIIILNSNKNIEISQNLFGDEYQLIGAEINNNQIYSNIFYLLFGCCLKKNNNQILYDDKELLFNLNKKDKIIDADAIKNGDPYVLFYKRNDNIKEKINDSSIIKENSEDLLISFDKENDNYGNKVPYQKYNNNSNKEEKKENITLYFTLKSNGKEIFIDTDNCKMFSEIVTEIKLKYEWAIYTIDENKLYFNNKNIDCHKTPKQLGIKSESTIWVDS